MLSTLMDSFRLASTSSLAAAQDLVPQLLSLACGSSPRPVRALLAASAHILARPDFLRAAYGDWDGAAAYDGAAAGAELEKAEWQLITVRIGSQVRGEAKNISVPSIRAIMNFTSLWQLISLL